MTSATDLHGAPHVERYLETNGEDGKTSREIPVVVLERA
jgi:hypothetical protein